MPVFVLEVTADFVKWDAHVNYVEVYFVRSHLLRSLSMKPEDLIGKVCNRKEGEYLSIKVNDQQNLPLEKAIVGMYAYAELDATGLYMEAKELYISRSEVLEDTKGRSIIKMLCLNQGRDILNPVVNKERIEKSANFPQGDVLLPLYAKDKQDCERYLTYIFVLGDKN